MANLTEQFKDARFAQQYFKDCENGDAITRKLMLDGATLNSPELIATLVQALNEADPIDENSDEAIQYRQSTAGVASSKSVEDSKPSGEKAEDKKESSDGSSRETSQSGSQPSSSPLFGK